VGADDDPPVGVADRPPTGLVYDLERFALHDGPGIRTLVFLKGCPLHCLWCSSPHTKSREPELLYDDGRCSTSGRCVEVCPQDALTLRGAGGIDIDRELCDGCGDCVEVCPSGALELAGRSMTPEQLFDEVAKDDAFFRRSGGGVTIGGGEPTAQHRFVLDFLKLCKRRYIHTAMETCGYVAWENLEQLIEHLDVLYVDLKHMDDEQHRAFTGVPNGVILENAQKSAERCRVILRIPVVPDFNDSDENILASARFAASLGAGVGRIELLPYHRLGVDVYRRLGETYRLRDVEPPDDLHLQHLKQLAESCGVEVRIGG
jgi:pyruvate formate lyase activating enzyme